MKDVLSFARERLTSGEAIADFESTVTEWGEPELGMVNLLSGHTSNGYE